MDLISSLTKWIREMDPTNEQKQINLQQYRERAKKPKSERGIDNLRNISPSQFHKELCLRRIVLAKLANDNVKLDERVLDEQTRWVYALHSYAHTMERVEFVSNISDGEYMPYGRWVCSNCKSVEIGFKPDSKCAKMVVVSSSNGLEPGRRYPCEELGEWIYNECPINNEELGVFGTADLLMKTPDGTSSVVVDYKYVGNQFFDSLANNAVRPAEKNVRQVQVYIEALKASYGILNYKNIDTLKELQFRVEPSSTIRGELLGIKQNILEYLEQKVIPNRLKECFSATCKKAQTCSLRTLCFKQEEIHAEKTDNTPSAQSGNTESGNATSCSTSKKRRTKKDTSSTDAGEKRTRSRRSKKGTSEEGST